MRLITVVKKNLAPILFVVVVAAILIYMTQRKEEFQTPVIGNSCSSATNIINGKCDSSFTFNTNTKKCEKTERYCENENEFVLSPSLKQCIKISDESIKIPSLRRSVVQNPSYRCNDGYVRIGDFKCAKSGRFVCPSGFPQRSSVICGRCSHLNGFVYTNNVCKNRYDPAIRVPVDIRPPICSA
jgi:hypothetical protein